MPGQFWLPWSPGDPREPQAHPGGEAHTEDGAASARAAQSWGQSSPRERKYPVAQSLKESHPPTTPGSTSQIQNLH